MEQKCSSCDQLMTCNSDKDCWCISFPPILRVDKRGSCLCKTCLTEQISNRISELTTDVTDEKLTFVAALGEPKQLIENTDYYFNQEGLFVFTAWYLMRRGYCCESGCLHCPYGYKKG